MLITIKIQPEMNCEYICRKIQEAINSYTKNSPDIAGALMIIDIKHPSQEDDSSIKKLEYKNSDA